MSTPRSEQIDINSTPYYHVIARCVRRSYLCGIDKLTQKDYSYRKEWIIARLKFLAQTFSIKIAAYAVMSNHYHVVLFVDDDAANKWSDDEVIARWKAIFPGDAKKHSHLPAKIPLWRERLTSISWFMRCINETIAVASNDEDGCSGRFWEGRFKCQALLDEGALLSAMAYVDLNPIRAGIAQTPEESESTSIYERIQCLSKKTNPSNTHQKPSELLPFSSGLETNVPKINMKISDYLELVDYTGRVFREDKVGTISESLPPILKRLNFDSAGWISMVENLQHDFYYAVGNEICLLNFSKNRKRAIKGIGVAKQAYLT
jgi:REP element-mobilizing transposase RayT